MSPLAALKDSGPLGRKEGLRCDLSAHLISFDERLPIRCIATSITHNAIVLVSMDELSEKSQVLLQLRTMKIALEVASCKGDPQHPAIFHAIVKTHNPAYHLQNFLTSEGLLPKTEARNEAQPLGHSSGQGALSAFQKLRETIAQARESDFSLLQNLGLESEHPQKRAYCIQFEGQSLIILMASQIQPAAVLELTSEEASQHLSILMRKRSHRGDSRWVKIWPLA